MISNPSERFLQDYHAAKIIQAFIYSLFAHLCALAPEIDKLVDYKSSFRLFNEHTCAFHSRYIANGTITNDSQIDTGKLFDDDAELDERIARVIAIGQNISFGKEGDYFFFKSDSNCVESCGLDHPQVSLLEDAMTVDDAMTESEIEKMLYRILPEVYTAWLHPTLGQMLIWPTLFHNHYHSGIWKTKEEKTQGESPNSSVMPWDSVKPFFDRRLG